MDFWKLWIVLRLDIGFDILITLWALLGAQLAVLCGSVAKFIKHFAIPRAPSM